MDKKPTPDSSKEDKNEDVVDTEDTEEEGAESQDEGADDTEGGEGGSDDKKNLEPDFKQLTEEERKRGKPDPEKAKNAFKKREAKREEKEGDDEDEDDEDRPMTRREAREFLEAQAQAAFKLVNSGRIRDIAYSLADSADEADYIVEIHKNRVWPTDMPLEEQIEEAHAIANRKRTASKTKELTRALIGKRMVNKGGSGSSRDGAQAPAPKVAADVLASLRKAGFTLDPKDRKWKKKLPNGKMLIKDSANARPRLV